MLQGNRVWVDNDGKKMIFVTVVELKCNEKSSLFVIIVEFHLQNFPFRFVLMTEFKFFFHAQSLATLQKAKQTNVKNSSPKTINFFV
jgi:hypothetical protein